MAGVSLTGGDSLIFFQAGIPLVVENFADGDVVNIEYPNNSIEVTTGKNGNAIYAFNSTGVQVQATLRVLRGSTVDKYLNSRLAEIINDVASFILIEAEFIKRVGDGQGNITSDTYRLGGGVVQKPPGVRENVAGETEQSVTIWNMMFTNSVRALT